MSKSLIIDNGHGGLDPGSSAFGVLEKDWALKMGQYQYERLKELGANVKMTRSTDITLNSTKRTDLIRNKYDLCISNHFNAHTGSGRGVETIHSIYGGKELATSLGNAISKVTGIPLRRVFTRTLPKDKTKDYYFMHRLTGNTRTVIIEYGFIDNQTDHNYYKNNDNFYKAAEAVVKVLAGELGIAYQPPTSANEELFRVQVGAFKERKNADDLVKRLKGHGYDAYITK